MRKSFVVEEITIQQNARRNTMSVSDMEENIDLRDIVDTSASRPLTSSTGLTLASYADAKKIPVQFLTRVDLSDELYKGTAAVRMSYRGLDGVETAARFRLRLAEDDHEPRFTWKSGGTASMYGLSRLSASHSSSIVLAIGESDCQTFWYQAVEALGLPGAGLWNESRDAGFFRSYQTVFIVEDAKNGDELRRSLSDSAIRERVRIVTLDGFEDPSAMFLDDPDRFRERWERAVARSVPWPIPLPVIEAAHVPPSQAISISEAYPGNHVAVQLPVVRPSSEASSKILRPTLSEDALYGVAGDFVRVTEPHSEADSAVLLTNILVGMGNVIGSNAHAVAQQVPHPLNLFAVVVGDTGKGRKGSSMGPVKTVLEQVESEWADNRIKSGLSSGEGLIFQMRDPSEKLKDDGEPEDPGADDKRLFVVEEEFGLVLHVIARQGNTLSSLLRQGWDGKTLATMTKNPMQASDPHLSAIGHITREELHKRLDENDSWNGFTNRFLWVYSTRSKYLPDGGDAPDYRDVVSKLQCAATFAKSLKEPIVRDEEARKLWHEVYPGLSDGIPGMPGVVTSRATAQVLRLSSLFAVLDCSPIVRLPHLRAALAFWQYVQDSTVFIFGDMSGDSTVDRIHEELQRVGDRGTSRTEINNFLGGHTPKKKIETALKSLVGQGLATEEEKSTSGRSSKIYRPKP
jgi:hypothetical protein